MCIAQLVGLEPLQAQVMPSRVRFMRVRLCCESRRHGGAIDAPAGEFVLVNRHLLPLAAVSRVCAAPAELPAWQSACAWLSA